MGGVKRTAEGVELSHRLIAISATLITLGGGFIGLTAATVRAADKVASAATTDALRDSVKAIRDQRHEDSVRSARHEADQDSTSNVLVHQVLGLLCEKYNNPQAWCGQGLPAQAGRPR